MANEAEDKDILLVDDDPAVLDLLKSILASRAFRIHTANTIAEAEQVLKTNHIDLVLLDLFLPDGSGIKLLKELRNGNGCSPNTIVMTAFGSWETHVKAYNLGAYYFLDKPFRVRQLRVLVDQALREQAHP